MNTMLRSSILIIKITILTLVLSPTSIIYAKECRLIDKMKDNEVVKVVVDPPLGSENSEPFCIKKTKKTIMDELNVTDQEDINLFLQSTPHLLNSSKCQIKPDPTTLITRQSSSFDPDIPIVDYLNESDNYLNEYQFMQLKALQQDWDEGIRKVEKAIESEKLDKYNRYPNDFHQRIFNLKDQFGKAVEKASQNAAENLYQLYRSLKNKVKSTQNKSASIVPINNGSNEADLNDNYTFKPKIESLLPKDESPLRLAKFGLGLTEASFGAVGIVFPVINVAAGSFSMLDTIAEGLLPSNKVGPENPLFHEFEANRDASNSPAELAKRGIRRGFLGTSVKKATPFVTNSIIPVKSHLKHLPNSLSTIHSFSFIPLELMTYMIPFINSSTIILKGFSKMYKAVTEPENGVEIIKAYTALHERIVNKAISQKKEIMNTLMIQGAGFIKNPNERLKSDEKLEIYSKLNCLCNAKDYLSNLVTKSEQSFNKRYQYLDNILSVQKKRDKLKDNLLKLLKQDKDTKNKAGWTKIISNLDHLNTENQKAADKYKTYFTSIPIHDQSSEWVTKYQMAIKDFDSARWVPNPDQKNNSSTQGVGQLTVEATTKKDRLNRQIDALFEIESSIVKLIQAHLDFSVNEAEGGTKKLQSLKEKHRLKPQLSNPIYTRQGDIRVRSTHDKTEHETKHLGTKIKESLDQIEHYFGKIKNKKNGSIEPSPSDSTHDTEPSH